ncbi:BlaI/MecI/CopY family transcriptional regulator [Paramuribaculum intestinale]|uniref:BlaI/MecI/CopY family transcriptional regulator n=1 Tax=Paramuribaculum intestinale TaxID=2094151 RepID=UPI0025B73600|nr:BlaI/MecI/CopY family transcriptional regulator [Paramuribaculum intestinale]
MDRQKTLSPKEEEIMTYFWDKGPLFVKEIVELWPEPKPHFNTISTFVRGLEAKGWLEHEVFGNTFRYRPKVELSEHRSSMLSKMVKNLFGCNYLNFVSTLVKDEKISTDELKELIKKIENNNND